VQIRLSPAHAHASSRFQGRIHAIAHQVDEDLLQLVGIRLDGHI
jgi:hypothetical protein